MAQRQDENESNKPRFVLMTPVVDDAERFAPELAAACAAADVAAVIVRLVPGSDAESLSRISLLAPGVHKVGAALLLDNGVHLVDAANADGVHVAGSPAVGAARGLVKSDRMVGAGNLPSRHDSMTAGESGADYVLFGEPGENGTRPTIDSLAERLAWWSKLFVVPCVAYAAHIDEIAPFIRSGADFIALGDEVIWNASAGAAAAIAAAAVRLEAAEPVE